MRFSVVALVLGAVAATVSAASLEHEARDVDVEARDPDFPKCSSKCWPPKSWRSCKPFDYKCFCKKHDQWENDYKKCFKKNCSNRDYHQSGKGVGSSCKKFGYNGWN